jgi:hypothetical protein
MGSGHNGVVAVLHTDEVHTIPGGKTHIGADLGRDGDLALRGGHTILLTFYKEKSNAHGM